ncbi:DUF2334 domain-containing protein [Halorientalis brevis]|uniref:DUF2334 domain-containing protein n=1 Tax=Halorientalis brevis TaxID=1126241 RepID=A0ABD6C6A3_9EURY
MTQSPNETNDDVVEAVGEYSPEATGDASLPDGEPRDHGRGGYLPLSPDASVSLRRRLLTGVVLVVILTISITGTLVAGPYVNAPADASPPTHRVQTIVIFRNDDIQPYYRTETMRAVDRIFVEESVPVTQGIIPMTGDRPIDETDDTCTYLRRRHRRHPELFEFALHGYTHEKLTAFYSGSEFGGLSPRNQLERIQKGTKIVKQCVGERPETFVPPMNTYDNTTAKKVAQVGYQTISGGSWFTREYYGKTSPFRAHGVSHVPNSASFVADWSTNRFRNDTELTDDFDRAYRNGTVYVQMIHYPTFDTPAKRERLRQFIDYMQSKEGVAFMTVDQYTDGIQRGTIRRVDDGWIVPCTADCDRTVRSGAAG